MKGFGQKVGAALVMILAILIAIWIAGAIIGFVTKANTPVEKDNYGGTSAEQKVSFMEGCKSDENLNVAYGADVMQTYCDCIWGTLETKYGSGNVMRNISKLVVDQQPTDLYIELCTDCVNKVLN